MLIIRYLSLILFVIAPQVGQAQLTIRGQVRSGKTEEVLPFATVFLSNTTKGTVTNEKGQFTLNNVPPGRFELIVSYMGFVTLKVPVQTQDQKSYKLLLKPSDNQLPDVTVKARRRRDPDRAKQLALFTDHFIGLSENAAQCRLINPEVLSFNQTTDRLIATANEPLLIDNKALGYRIKFQLDQFIYEYDSYQIAYEGNPVFEAMRPVNAKESERWAENRKKAYLGSMMHFARALYRRQVSQEGFAFQRVIERRNRNGDLIRTGLPGDTTLTFPSLSNDRQVVSLPMARYRALLDTIRSTDTQPVIAFKNLIQVTYTKEKEPLTFQKARRFSKFGYKIVPQSSLIRLLKPGLTVEANGQFWPPQGIRSEGYWSWELVADDLPFDYEPDAQ